MREIRVFIASSEELKQERVEILDVINNLNFALYPSEIEILPIKWEYLDASMCIKHKQEEYNDELKKCDIFVALFWTRLGEYTEIELNTAYQELCSGHNPKKIYVYFKDSDTLTPQMKAFKESFATRYGHFYSRFSNTDTMNLNFVLQVVSYINHSFDDEVFSVNDGKITVAGHPVASFDNLPFAVLNKDYQRLRENRQHASQSLEEAKQAFLRDSDNSAKDNAFFSAKKNKEKADEEFNNYLESLLRNALNFVRISGEACSARIAEARELFESGKISEADKLLSFERLEDETEKEIEYYLQTRKKISSKVNEWMLKASISLANSDLPYGDRVKCAAKAYDKAVNLAEATDYPLDELSFLISQQLDFVMHYSLFTESERVSVKLVSVERKKYDLGVSEGDELACALINLARVMLRQNRMEEAEDLLNESMRYGKNWDSPGDMPLLVRERIAFALESMGDIYSKKGATQEALHFYERAEHFLVKDGYDDVPPWILARLYENTGKLYKQCNMYEEAEEYFSAAKAIRVCLFNLNNRTVRSADDTPYITVVGIEDGVLRIQYNPYHPESSDYAIDLMVDIIQLALILIYNGKEKEAFREFEGALHGLCYLNEDDQIRHRSELMNILAGAAFLESKRGNYEKAKELYEKAISICEALEDEQPGCFTDEMVRILGNAMAIFQDEQSCIYGERAIDLMDKRVEYAPANYYPKLISTIANLLSIYVAYQNEESILKNVKKALAYYDAIAERCPDVAIMSMPDCFKQVLPLLSTKLQEDLLTRMIGYYTELQTSDEAMRSRMMIICILKLADNYRKSQGKEKAQETFNRILPYALYLINIKAESEDLVPFIVTDMALDDINMGLFEYAIEKLQYALDRYNTINADGKYDDVVNAITNKLQQIQESLN